MNGIATDRKRPLRYEELLEIFGKTDIKIFTDDDTIADKTHMPDSDPRDDDPGEIHDNYQFQETHEEALI
ncbi:hypothetical protein JTB14_011551 [Gonioctena quinquepunctata]|nr:hypothetical protein JTB14_011551 [Gonioctena quinquepunctata]